MLLPDNSLWLLEPLFKRDRKLLDISKNQAMFSCPLGGIKSIEPGTPGRREARPAAAASSVRSLTLEFAHENREETLMDELRDIRSKTMKFDQITCTVTINLALEL